MLHVPRGDRSHPRSPMTPSCDSFLKSILPTGSLRSACQCWITWSHEWNAAFRRCRRSLPRWTSDARRAPQLTLPLARDIMTEFADGACAPAGVALTQKWRIAECWILELPERPLWSALQQGLGLVCERSWCRWCAPGYEWQDAGTLGRRRADSPGSWGQVIEVASDITTEERAAVLEATGHVDILVNNAGGPPPGDFRDWTRETWILRSMPTCWRLSI